MSPEAKFNRERLQLEAANVDRQELLTRQRLSAEEAQRADEVLQQQIRSAQEVPSGSRDLGVGHMRFYMM